VISLPLTIIEPLSGFSNPAMRNIRVLLPYPEGAKRPMKSPSSITKLAPSNTLVTTPSL